MPVDKPHDEYLANVDDWQKCRDVAYGRKKVHSAGETYLPKLSHSDAATETANYKAYKMRAGFYNATGRTIEGLSGMIFRKDPIYEYPAAMQSIIDDITLGGESLRALSEQAVDEVLTVGRLGVLVDFPGDIMGPISLADAEKMNRRPHASIYKTESILNWRYERKNNAHVLTRVILEETTATQSDKDEFDETTQTQWRVLDLDLGYYRQRVFVDNEGTKAQLGDDIYPKMNGQTMSFIPFEFFSACDDTKTICKSPILDLVEMNLAHYRNMADLEHGAHYTALPTPVFSGLSANDLEEDEDGNKKPIAIGSGEAVLIPTPDGKAQYLEFTGAGLKALRELAGDKKDEMATLGARMIASDKRAAETAETHQIKRHGENSALASVAKSVSASLHRVLEILRDWSGASGDIAVRLNTDFIPAEMSPQLLKEMVAACQAGKMPFESLWWNMQRGEVVQPDMSHEDALEKIEDDDSRLLSGTDA